MLRHQDLPSKAPNQAAVTQVVNWPNKKRSCLFLSFDFDAETAWADENAEDSKKLVTMSYGGYGARVGVPKLLELLKKLDMLATFFVPGWVVEIYTEQCEKIVEAGHEIGHHGYYHLAPSLEEPEQFYEEIDRGFEVLKRCLGVKPIGYRAPCGENYAPFLNYLSEKGIKYSSSWRDQGQ